MNKVTAKPQLHASWIDRHAIEIVKTLKKAGHTTYLVGGCVRDLLVGIHPKDYDIATDASPNEVKRKIRGAYVIGRRFRLVLIKRGNSQFEVATFRRQSTPEDFEDAQAAEAQAQETLTSASGEIEPEIQQIERPMPPLGDNFFGTPEQDALRRDFTINALFYDPLENEVIDYADGLKDIKSHTLRMIGDPTERIIEDPIRSFRAIRLSHKIKFKIEDSLREAIQKNAAVTAKAVLPRRREEYLKFLRLPEPALAFAELYDLGMVEHVLPSLKVMFDDHDRREIFLHYMSRWDELVLDPSDPVALLGPFLFAVLRAYEGHPQKDEFITKLIRDEMMIFKAETAKIFAAIEMEGHLKNLEFFRRKGYRRQQAFLRNDALPMALTFAKRDYLLSSSDLLFWESHLKQMHERGHRDPMER